MEGNLSELQRIIFIKLMCKSKKKRLIVVVCLWAYVSRPPHTRTGPHMRKGIKNMIYIVKSNPISLSF